MASMILAEATANVSDLQQNPTATLATGHGLPVAILDHFCSTACSTAWKISS